METILVMLSGGLDSVYMLYHYLTETSHPLHVHHISLRYPQFNRWIVEDPASRKIVDYCQQQYRFFEYSESRFDMQKLNEVGMDSDLHLLVASKLAPNLGGSKVALALGHNYDDDPVVSMPTRLDKVWLALLDRVRQKERIVQDILKPLIALKLTKEDICRKMPDALLRMCWSCRMPNFSHGPVAPCGWCKTCKKIEGILSAMGRSADFPNLVRPPSLGPCRGRDRFVAVDAGQQASADAQPNRPVHAGQADAAQQPAPRVTARMRPPAGSATPMSRNTGRKSGDDGYSPWFKVQVAFAAMINGQSDEQLAMRYNIDPCLVREWKQRLQHEIRLAAGGRAQQRTRI